jgi:iron complex transport system ATP-binding protein
LGVLLIVHDLNLAASWVNRMALLRDGCVAALGTPQEVVTVEQMRDVFDVTPQIVAHPRNGRPWMAF